MNDINICKTLPVSEYYDLIVKEGEEGLEAAYYLLTMRLDRALRGIFELYGFGLNDDYKDTIDDFFLYLYEGNLEATSKPFAMMERIRNKKAFFAWVLGTYRRFLLNRAKDELKRRELLEHASLLAKEEPERYPEDVLVHFLASAIAYADQQFVPRNRFILYRVLLSFLDHRRAIPQEAMAGALNMHPVTYRVSSKRQKDRLMALILLQEAGQTLELDPWHSSMCKRISDDFNHLYKVLLEYYEQTLEKLPSARDIYSLRLAYGRCDGVLMHERAQAYGFRDTADVRQLYEALKLYATS